MTEQGIEEKQLSPSVSEDNSLPLRFQHLLDLVEQQPDQPQPASDRPENPSRKSPSAEQRDPASTSGSSSQADKRSTRDTSASEAIYSRPINLKNQGIAGYQDPVIQALLNDPQI